MDLTGMLQAAAGAAGEENLYIEDVFSTYLYTGTGAAQTITNDIDLDGEGGLVWIKSRNSSDYSHILVDSERPLSAFIQSNSTAVAGNNAQMVSSFNSDGFSIGSSGSTNASGVTYASWTFRKAEKFFDVVTYTGNGANRTIAHNLGSVPGCIMVKRTDNTGNWQVYHRANTANPETDFLILNTNAATADSNTRWNDTQPTSTVFSLGTEATVNASGGTYVAYLFAHNAGGFGEEEDQNVISCGSYSSGSGSSNIDVNLGFEPQWVLVKDITSATSSSGHNNHWLIYDTMRKMDLSGTNSTPLAANLSSAEPGEYNHVGLGALSTGFRVPSGIQQLNDSGNHTYIYIAIRRGPMKTPTSGTEVFSVSAITTTTPTTSHTVGFPADFLLQDFRTFLVSSRTSQRLTGSSAFLSTASTAADDSGGGFQWDLQDNFAQIAGITTGIASYFFKRAPGFFDVVCYTGTGANRTVAHNLGVVPELIIVKNRSQADAWAVYAGDNTDYLVLNTTAATADLNTYWNDASPTSTVFTVGTVHNTNASAENYVAYLFASLAGISKVGTYTGNGSSVTVTTGFQPRFILVKRTDSTGNWIVGDSARGLVAGDDPFSALNTTDAETTNQDWVDVSATGFTVNETAANANVNTGTYLYLAIS